ncbi:MAG: tetratricopeptide repeat protein [Betaproteobacteria bacterium]|nr:tetratricopeptide repeat protein [Betaproteobacteria bacterium]
MSLLLKALKQAEAANPGRAGSGRADPELRLEGDLELEPAPPDTARAREWIEPPDLLLGNGNAAPGARTTGGRRWPQLSLVPLTALLAVLIAIGYGIYLYFALQPPAAVATPARSSAVKPAAPAATEPALPRAPAPAAAEHAQPAAPTPESVAASSARPHEPAPPARSSAAPAASARTAAAPARRATKAELPVFEPDPQTNLLTQAYAAYQHGNLAEAQRLYGQAAARSPNVDALLGLAAIASAQNRDGDAQRLYRAVLDLDPRNAVAQGALLDLLGTRDDQASESRLKTLIDRAPSAELYQALGNLYAGQGRWSDAQAAYFEAFRDAPGNADYAFNLAVSLDQLQQYPSALTYYEKALAAGGAHRYDRAQAEARVHQLKSLR